MPLGRKTSVCANTLSSASLMPVSCMISRRTLGSKDTVPPLAFTAAVAASTTSVAFSENSDEPMT